jgi:hypothetical protein
LSLEEGSTGDLVAIATWIPDKVGFSGIMKGFIFPQYLPPNQMNESRSLIYNRRMKDIVEQLAKHSEINMDIIEQCTTISITNVFKCTYVTMYASILLF